MKPDQSLQYVNFRDKAIVSFVLFAVKKHPECCFFACVKLTVWSLCETSILKIRLVYARLTDIPGLLRMERHNDLKIRKALLQTKLKQFNLSQSALVVEELGLAHARSRIDLAVLSSVVHGFEIKSERDNLSRLERQLSVYSACLERLTLVCASKHLDSIVDRTPSWCGVLEASRGPRGAVVFHSIKRARRNPNIDKRMLAHLLWHREAAELVSAMGFEGSHLRQPRNALYELIADRMTVRQITSAIGEFMRRREGWRGRPTQLTYDG